MDSKTCQKCNNLYEKKPTMSKKKWSKSKYCSSACQISSCIAVKGRHPWNYGLTGYKMPPASEERKRKISKAQRGRKYPHRCGAAHFGWKGGTSLKQRPVWTSEYQDWRSSVFERDNFTCVICEKKGGYLNADHIQSWAQYPELRYEVNNGRTLCVACHYFETFSKPMPKGSKWGRGNNSKMVGFGRI